MPTLVTSLVPFLLAAVVFTATSIAVPASTTRTQASTGTLAASAVSASLAAVSEAAAQAAAFSDAAYESAAYASDGAYASGTLAVDGAYASGSYGANLPAATGPDACGPKIPDPTVPDSCYSYVNEVTAPAAYGVQCLNDGTGDTLNTTSCEEIIPIMCSDEFQNAGQWVWATNNGCSLGSYLPEQNGTGAAMWPNQTQCELLIYEAMLDACDDGTNKYNYAGVNLKVLPNNTPGGEGEQVNAGYGSYLISPTQPRNQSDKTCYDPKATLCAYVESPNYNSINVAGTLAQEVAAELAAFSSESAVLATMTGAAAAAARSDLAAYQSQVII